jgi:hypothetical protein
MIKLFLIIIKAEPERKTILYLLTYRYMYLFAKTLSSCPYDEHFSEELRRIVEKMKRVSFRLEMQLILSADQFFEISCKISDPRKREIRAIYLFQNAA